jgi:putative endonuclease
MYVVYILHSSEFDKSYVGYTSDLIDRFHSHNSFSQKGFTSKYRPWIVVHVEFFETKLEAMKREKYLKSGRGLYKKHEIIINFLNKV